VGSTAEPDTNDGVKYAKVELKTVVKNVHKNNATLSRKTQ